MDIENWLKSIGLEDYLAIFKENAIDGSVLLRLTGQDLINLGITKLGHRRILVDAIEQLGSKKPASLNLSPAFAPGVPASGIAQSVAAGKAERRHLTVMFVDMVGSTEISSRFDPEEVREVLIEFQNTVAKIINHYGGFVARFMGDGVKCYFGWPQASEHDAERAVRAGLSVIDNIKRSSTPDGQPLATRVGLASGLVVVGDLIGSGVSEQAAVVGETPHLAARLQNLAQPNQLVLPESTEKLLGDLFTLKTYGYHQLKGISRPVKTFLVVDENTRESRFEARHLTAVGPLLGRELELKLIHDGWERAVSGSGRVIVISGDAGIGKSRLVRAVIDDLDPSEYICLTHQCSPYHADSAFYPVIHQIKYVSGITPADTDEQRIDKLKAFSGVTPEDLPLFAAMLGCDTTDDDLLAGLTPQQLRAHTMEALIRTLVSQSQVKPLLIIFEDLHWIDPTTLELLDRCLNAIGEHRVLILVTTRPTFSHDLDRHPNVKSLSLTQLSDDEVVAMIGELALGKSVPEEVLQVIAERADGVPLFVEELTQSIFESDLLQETVDGYVLNSPT